MAITASVQPELGRIAYAGSDFPHPFQLRFSKEAMDLIVQNRPGSDLDDLFRIWPNASVLEASRCAGIIGPGFWQDATGLLPVSHFLNRFRSSTDVPDNIVQKQPGSDLVLADCVTFCQTDPVRKQANVQEWSGPLLADASQPIRTGCESDQACLLGLFLEHIVHNNQYTKSIRIKQTSKQLSEDAHYCLRSFFDTALITKRYVLPEQIGLISYRSLQYCIVENHSFEPYANAIIMYWLLVQLPLYFLPDYSIWYFRDILNCQSCIGNTHGQVRAYHFSKFMKFLEIVILI